MRGGIRILNVPARVSGGERMYSAVSPVDTINIKAALMYFSFDNEKRLSFQFVICGDRPEGTSFAARR